MDAFSTKLIWNWFYTTPTKNSQRSQTFSTLKINNETIYSPFSPMAKAEHVFASVENKLDSTALAVSALNLVQQDTGGEVLKLIALQKGITKPEKFIHNGVELEGGISTHTVIETDRHVMINTHNSGMSIIMESLVLQRDIMDPEEGLSYFKVKTTISGSQDDFNSKNAEKLSIKTAYTAESDSKEAALKKDYSMILAARTDPKSYLTA